MDADERDIFQFLKTRGTDFVGAMEIARRAGNKKRFYEDPDWAKVVLMRMGERGILERDVWAATASNWFPERIKTRAGLRRTSPKSSTKAAWKLKPAVTLPRTSITSEL